ncbi:MAG: hypothetical protein UV38_C0003G0042 [candidate division TM6 bacterium GW2011_GWE2_42_60]|nr:MAG: hypothetical protein UV38_C0003G0042 [candidate division TM6 bacterium GW2011_GWE2_42_60]HBY05476.1 hypothetical protein [Candidatus Dependentiae bacterium]
MNNTLSPKLILFDCDGVLVDSELLSYRIYTEEFAQEGLHKTPEELLKIWSGFSLDAMIKAAEVSIKRPISPHFKQRLNTHIFKAFLTELRPIAGIPHFLEQLKKHSITVCVVSNGEQDRVNSALITTKLDSFFPTPNRFNVSMVKNGKPAPDLLLLAAKTMGVTPNQCLVIDDSVTGINAAQAAQMPVVGFLAGAHAQAPWYQKRLYKTHAPFFTHSTGDLCALLGDICKK